MLRQQCKKSKVKRGKTRFPNITEDAAALGVHRTHLWRVLTGERHSPLLARYRSLKQQQTLAA